MFTSSISRCALFALCMFIITLPGPAKLLAGVIFIPIGNCMGENVQGDKLGIKVRGIGPDLTGMIGKVKFKNGATGEKITIDIADSDHSPQSSVITLKDQAGDAIVEIDLPAVSLTWLDDNTTFQSGADKVKCGLRGRTRIVP